MSDQERAAIVSKAEQETINFCSNELMKRCTIGGLALGVPSSFLFHKVGLPRIRVLGLGTLATIAGVMVGTYTTTEVCMRKIGELPDDSGLRVQLAYTLRQRNPTIAHDMENLENYE